MGTTYKFALFDLLVLLFDTLHADSKLFFTEFLLENN
jgi:hypothetical protein